MRNGKVILRVVFLSLLLLLAACGQKALTYEEQIDLGQRFLGDGDYEQAIVAFTAAIQIEPKLSPAYVGLADAHKGLGQPEEAVAAIRQGVEAISDVASSSDLIAWAETFGDEAFAAGDYDTAILAYDTLVFADPRSEYFQKLAEAYVAVGNIDSAIEILRRGYEYTGDEALSERLEELEPNESFGVYLGTYTVVGTIIGQGSFEGEQRFQGFEAQYHGAGGGGSGRLPGNAMVFRVGVRFAEPIALLSGETVSSAAYVETYEFKENLQLYGDTDSELIELPYDQALTITGRLYFDENLTEITPSMGNSSMNVYNPWGSYRFESLSIER
jgi:tetratricopeptide (TPR) repeat protein